MKKLKETGIKNPKIPSSETMDKILAIDPDEDGKAFDFDYWFVDEGQDFKEAEKTLLRKLFGLTNSVISISRGQWVRDFQDNEVNKNDWNKDGDKFINENLSVTEGYKKFSVLTKCW